MTSPSLATFAALALGGTLAILGLLRAGAWLLRRPWPSRLTATVFFVTLLVVLSQVPFPDPATMRCPIRTARPDVVPFVNALRSYVRAWPEATSLPVWALNSGLLAATANFVLGGLIGAALARQGLRFRAAALFGLALSLGIELTQLTATWGLFPCPYRKFDATDLILNTLGVALGHRLARPWTLPIDFRRR